jgi:DNA-binding LacI/PurR family transcriptional regulator
MLGAVPGTIHPFVDIDNRAAARQAVEHLIRLGHSRIACITNALPSYVASAERMKGYQDALQSHGIAHDPQMVRYGDFDPESGYRQMKNLLIAVENLTAVFVASDVVALGAMRAIREHGLSIPRDIALVGFDDVTVSQFIEPSLTTMRLPLAEMAHRACDMLIGLIQGNFTGRTQVFLDAKLIVRTSCGARPAADPFNDLYLS